MLYNGQEVGDPALGAEGFSEDDGRTSIFDYTTLPALQAWVNGGRFDAENSPKCSTNYGLPTSS